MPDRLTKSTDYVREAPYKPLPIAPQNCVAWVKRKRTHDDGGFAALNPRYAWRFYCIASASMQINSDMLPSNASTGDGLLDMQALPSLVKLTSRV